MKVIINFTVLVSFILTSTFQVFASEAKYYDINQELTKSMSSIQTNTRFTFYYNGYEVEAKYVSKGVSDNGRPIFYIDDIEVIGKVEGDNRKPEGHGASLPKGDSKSGSKTGIDFGKHIEGATLAGLGKGAGYLVFSPSAEKKLAGARQRVKDSQKRLKLRSEAFKKQLIGDSEKMAQGLGTALSGLSKPQNNFAPIGVFENQENPSDDYKFLSTDQEFLDEAKLIYNNLKDFQPSDEIEEIVIHVGISSVKVADEFSANGEIASSRAALKTARIAADYLVGIDPYTGFVRDLTEFITGENMITGEPLTDAERFVSGISLAASSVTFGIASSAKNMVKASIKIAKKSRYYKSLSKSAGKVFHKVSTFFEKADQVKKSNANDFVQSLPDLKGEQMLAFEGHIFKGEYSPGDILIQGQNLDQSTPGNWFGTITPLDSSHAEDLWNIAKWDKSAEKLKVFIVKKPVSGYAGKVSGAEGYQFFIPYGVNPLDVLEEVETINLK